MAKVPQGNAVVGQSGGPTAVINQSLVGVIEASAKASPIERLLGARHGVRGMKNSDFIDLKGLPAEQLERVANTPAAALGSSRDKPDAEYCKAVLDVFAQNNVRYFFYIGGNDSADTARIVGEMAGQQGYDLRTFHVCKTIDNDLRVTDHCPGYGSAARFVACAMMGDDRDNASLPGIKIDIIMGRNAGWLTAATALARRDESDGPHLIYVPERPVSADQFAADVKGVYEKYGRCVVAASEGIIDVDGKLWAEKVVVGGEVDAHGNKQLSGSGSLGDALAALIKNRLSDLLGGKKLRVRADTFGYLQRSFAGFASPVDAKEARTCGRKAVQYAMAGRKSGSAAMRRVPGDKYAVKFFRAELADVARNTKPLPDEFIAANGHDVTPAFLDYLRPLVGKLPQLGKL